MKTGRSKTETIVFKDMNTTSVPTKEMKKNAPAIMTEAFSDKENVVERTHAIVSITEPAKQKVAPAIMTEALGDKGNVVERTHAGVNITEPAKPKINITEKKKVRENTSCEEKIQITADDLTNPNGPSENYYRLLAEERQKALKETVEENEKLRSRCELLEAENDTLKQALQEATEIIEVLNEIVSEEKMNETQSELENQTSSTSSKSSPAKEQPKTESNAFGNDSTVYDDSDDSGQE